MNNTGKKLVEKINSIENLNRHIINVETVFSSFIGPNS